MRQSDDIHALCRHTIAQACSYICHLVLSNFQYLFLFFSSSKNCSHGGLANPAKNEQVIDLTYW
jgi:hypothetical protein